jgi:hypothetical protein
MTGSKAIQQAQASLQPACGQGTYHSMTAIAAGWSDSVSGKYWASVTLVPGDTKM